MSRIRGLEIFVPIRENAPRGLKVISRKATKEAVQDTLDDWFLDILPVHFTLVGANRYGYVKRTIRYMKRKLKKFGHASPLVWSGEFRDAMLQRKPATKFKDKLTRAELTFKGLPKYAFIINKTDKTQEVTSVSDLDRRRMVKRFKETFINRMNAKRG